MANTEKEATNAMLLSLLNVTKQGEEVLKSMTVSIQRTMELMAKEVYQQNYEAMKSDILTAKVAPKQTKVELPSNLQTAVGKLHDELAARNREVAEIQVRLSHLRGATSTFAPEAHAAQTKNIAELTALNDQLKTLNAELSKLAMLHGKSPANNAGELKQVQTVLDQNIKPLLTINEDLKQQMKQTNSVIQQVENQTTFKKR